MGTVYIYSFAFNDLCSVAGAVAPNGAYIGNPRQEIKVKWLLRLLQTPEHLIGWA